MTGDATEAVILYGTEQPPAPIQRFQQGPLSFDLEAGKLRYIRLAGIEVLRSIAFVASPVIARFPLRGSPSRQSIARKILYLRRPGYPATPASAARTARKRPHGGGGHDPSIPC